MQPHGYSASQNKKTNTLISSDRFHGDGRCLLSDSFTDVKVRRTRLVIGWVTARGRLHAVNLVPFVGGDLKL